MDPRFGNRNTIDRTIRGGVADEVITRSGMSLQVSDDPLQQQLDAFAEKINSDMNFRQQAVAAVLSNPETKAAFLEKLSYESQTCYPELKNLNVIPLAGGTYKYSYSTGKSVTDQLAGLSVKGNPVSTPPGQLILVSCNGSEWSGFLIEAAPYVKYLVPGIIVMPLLHALLGTKAGLVILPALLLLL